MGTAEKALHLDSLPQRGRIANGKKPKTVAFCLDLMDSVNNAVSLYEQGLAAFRAGETASCADLTRQSLAIGRQLNEPGIIGRGLTGLSRVALRENDGPGLRNLCGELTALAESSGDDWWLVVATHMQAELARLNHRHDEAGPLYDRSMEISRRLGRTGMVATECCNKSFVALAKGETVLARDLIRSHFEIRARLDTAPADIQPTGLIALSCLHAVEGDFESALEAATACRRILFASGEIPDPADEEPLRKVEQTCARKLPPETQQRVTAMASGFTCRDVVQRWLSAPST